jgi:MFS family permease
MRADHAVPAKGWLGRLKDEGGINGLSTIASSALGVGVGLLGLPILTIGLFMVPLHSAFGWSRAEIAGASTCINVATIVAAPFVGRLCDRFGVRPVALASLCSLAVGFACLAFMDGSRTLYYLIWFLLSAGGVGTSGIVWTRAIGTYYRANRGLALGLALTGTAFAALIPPLTLGPLIHDHGWRAGFVALSIISLITIPVTYLAFSERKRDAHSAVIDMTLLGSSLAEASRSPVFWKLGVGIFFLIVGMGSCVIHFVPAAIDAGLPPLVAQRLFSVVGLSMLIGRITIGRLLDTLNPLTVAVISLALPALGCLLLATTPGSAATFAIAAASFGFSAGAEVDILAFMVARYFGLRSYGAIYGTLLVFFAAGSGTGSILTGHVRDVSGSYEPAMIGGVVVFLLGAVLVGMMGPATPRLAHGRTESERRTA